MRLARLRPAHFGRRHPGWLNPQRLVKANRPFREFPSEVEWKAPAGPPGTRRAGPVGVEPAAIEGQRRGRLGRVRIDSCSSVGPGSARRRRARLRGSIRPAPATLGWWGPLDRARTTLNPAVTGTGEGGFGGPCSAAQQRGNRVPPSRALIRHRGPPETSSMSNTTRRCSIGPSVRQCLTSPTRGAACGRHPGGGLNPLAWSGGLLRAK